MIFSLILNFSKQDLKDKYTGSVLGGLWAFIIPLTNILMFTLIFSKIMGARLGSVGAGFEEYGYSIYLICGIVPWAAFSSTLLRVTTIYRDKAGLIGKVQLSLLILPVYIVLSESFVFIVSMIFFVGFLLLIGFPLDIYWFLIPLVFLIQQMLAFSIGLVLAVLSVFIEDIREMMPVLVQFWFWLTPVVYVVTILPAEYMSFMTMNPYYHFAQAYRDIVIGHQMPDLLMLLKMLGLSLFIFGFGAFLLKKLERDIRDFV